MSEDDAKLPKKGGLLKSIVKILILALLAIGLVAGGSVAGGYFLPRYIPAIFAPASSGNNKANQSKVDENLPKKVPLDEKDASSGQFKASYYAFDKPFISNVQNSSNLVQIGIGVATYYDERVINNIKKDELPIRSAILMTISNQDNQTISTEAGKKQLQNQIKDVINGVLKDKEGFGGVDSIYFTSFLIQ
ncbi:MAG: flagellar basal body-associated FliL family protein [Zymomonas mobilis subsp. pomaceae]|uniref:Flagellar protein FliL n=1 Tax=Zymomonas mobilis subsp. pomaceae (strain ATCC 29192 / DSM 22645 / JCM 10191 / CCUG 17912 / NBRC 13757 / NCIMB 11200 / NRRL B-4491 / Barker I) TaxID=579138 RepID=F8ERN1_ZYMMT|nr:flagellar basal body-associated FliL family protein [Zymomonas mobilis]AEI37489.1 flagellar basal body-associated protein FliL [Zymomonas mobilis subsp. pomaceae ATCC 29192]MDX5948857.1 flagellar basal body-associated FliL family protein [Zymomonas mobilis subsp. pomaceae]GEB88664.1 hypothetical protein ZMO02_03010 [Zymomonas mobilis subsp. pomaceae]